MVLTKLTIPENIRRELPEPAQQVYIEAYNDAYRQLPAPHNRTGQEAREMNARRMAWSAVKERFENQADGVWRPRIFARREDIEIIEGMDKGDLRSNLDRSVLE